MHRRAGDDGARQAHQLLPPRVELTRADTVFAGDLGCGQIRPEALGDNLAILLGRPRTPRFRPGQNLDASCTSTPTITRTSALSFRDQVRRHHIHLRTGSYSGHEPPDVVAATLTVFRGRRGDLLKVTVAGSLSSAAPHEAHPEELPAPNAPPSDPQTGRPSKREPALVALQPAVPIDQSVFAGYLVSLEDGSRYRSLKRHLRAKYGMTPDDYRKKWELPDSYPMVAPDYARERSEVAKRIGLGKRPSDTPPAKIAAKVTDLGGARSKRGKP